MRIRILPADGTGNRLFEKPRRARAGAAAFRPYQIVRRASFLKRIVGALLIAALLILCVACGVPTVEETAPTPSPTVAATSRDAHDEPVRVDETYAVADVTDPTAAPSATAAPTPSTGDAPMIYVIGTVGLILFCSAGLLMLKRI